MVLCMCAECDIVAGDAAGELERTGRKMCRIEVKCVVLRECLFLEYYCSLDPRLLQHILMDHHTVGMIYQVSGVFV